jgi:hypothetical protein
MNIINSTWAFKCKRYPDGLIKKFKARFCARGDQQLQGIDFFETYAPVVQWMTIHLMFVLEVILGLKSLQGDIICAFLHADLEENNKVYVNMPAGFSQYDKNGKKMCLKLKKTLYGLRQSPREFLGVHHSKAPRSWVGTVKVQSMLVYWPRCHLHCLCR